jgi:hypothetical protein
MALDSDQREKKLGIFKSVLILKKRRRSKTYHNPK